MTKKEIIFWLEDKRNQKIGEKEAEAKEKQREIYKEVLAPLGFYEAASQIKEHLQQALEIWRGWKKTQGPTVLGFAFRDYLGFEQQTIRWLEGEMPFEAFLEEHDIFLSPNLFQELNQEKGETIHNIHLTYNTVIKTVRSAKSVKEAKAYLENLGFDLSELEKKCEAAADETNIDTSFLLLKQSAGC